MLIAIAVYDTEENERSWMTEECLDSVWWAINNGSNKYHRVIVVDNGSCEKTKRILRRASVPRMVEIITNETNIGTAKAINQAWRFQGPGVHLAKMDNDINILYRDAFDEMEDVLARNKDIGILGLKRKDLEERPDHPEPHYRSALRMLPHNPGERWVVVEEVNHVMGSCQAYSANMLPSFGYLYQMDGLYGFDDALASCRAHVLGFKTCFLPHIEINHIDPGGTDYTMWKKEYAGKMIDKYFEVKKGYEDGTISPYYDGY